MKLSLQILLIIPLLALSSCLSVTGPKTKENSPRPSDIILPETKEDSPVPSDIIFPNNLIAGHASSEESD